MTALLCLSTCPDRETAERIARALVDERLAACVNLMSGVRSVYRWQGTIETGDEILLLAKTVAGRADALAARIAVLHPYELPEVVTLEIGGGLPAYLDWIARETAPEPDA